MALRSISREPLAEMPRNYRLIALCHRRVGRARSAAPPYESARRIPADGTCFRALLAQEEHEFLVLHHLLDRAQPFRTFGMARRVEVLKASGVGYKKRHSTPFLRAGKFVGFI